MAEVKWIKVSTDMFDRSRKIKQIETMPKGDTTLIIWIKLLLLAGVVNDGGAIYVTPEIPYTVESLANELRRPPKAVQAALGVFEAYGMVEIINGFHYIVDWDKHQNVDGLEKIREQTKARVADYRARKKLEASNDTRSASASHCNAICNATVTQCNETELDKEKDIDNTTTTTTKYIPPALATIFVYFNSLLDGGVAKEAEKFHAYNANRGWDCLPDWKSAADLWIARIEEKRG